MADTFHFRRQQYRLAIPCLFAAVMFGLFAYNVPNGRWVAAPALGLTLLFASLLHGGLVLSPEGIAWYVLTPRWRYRFIPWGAVIEAQKSRFGQPRIRVTAEPGRYEPWVWGAVRPGRPIGVTIWTRNYADGEHIWPAVHHFWKALQPTEHGA